MTETLAEKLDFEAFRVARETRNFEISLFWQRSNYFLVLSTAIAVGFFSQDEKKRSLLLAVFGAVVGIIWFLVNLGSKFWQSRWEERLRIVERRLRPDMNLFSADWETVQADVRDSFKFRKRGRIYQVYAHLILLKPSVSMMMTLLSLLFVLFWVLIICAELIGGGEVPDVMRHPATPALILQPSSGRGLVTAADGDLCPAGVNG